MGNRGINDDYFLGDVALLNNNFKQFYVPRFPYIFNLEYVIGNDECFQPTCGKVNLLSKNSNFNTYFGKNPVAVTISNNHTLDYGDEGVASTKRVLNDKHIGIIEANRYWYDKQTCMMSYSCVGSMFDKNNLFAFTKDKCERSIKTAIEEGAKSIIVFMHWELNINHMLVRNKLNWAIG